MQSEEYRLRRIPENYENGIHIAGFCFRPIFLIEGSILCIVLGSVSFFCMLKFGLKDFGQMIGISLVFAGSGLFIGIKGINDEPITLFLKHLKTFNKNKRVSLYNPRIKTEAKSIFDEKQKELLPKEKILAIFNKYKDSLDKKEQEKVRLSFDSEEGNQIVFLDDIGVIPRQKKSDLKKLEKKKSKVQKFRREIDV